MFTVETTLRPTARRLVAHHARCGLLAGLLLPATLIFAAEPGGAIVSEPIAATAPPASQTMFVKMPADQTGIVIENRYADPRMWGDRYLEAGVGSIGSGVTIGDYDGDGRPDIFVASKSDSCRLFRNLGNWKFEDVTDAAGVGDKGDAAVIWKQGATFADVNNDGRLDIYLCRFDAPNLLYINQGDGTFKESARAYRVDIRDASGMAAFLDYDRDGWLDVFVQTNLLNIAQHPNGERNHLLHNNGTGTFTDVTDRAGITGEGQGHSATCWDYDGDGWPDIYVANDFGVPDKLYHNNRDGTFTDAIESVVPHTTFASMGSDVGDINNDGDLDFFVADMASTTHQKDQRTASGVRSGADDPAAVNRKVPKYLHNALYVNTGAGRCREAAFLAGIAATDWTWSVRLEDLDNDGRLDLFVTNGMNREQSNVDLISREMKAESAGERMRIMRESPVMFENNIAYRNTGDLKFENVSAAWGLDERTVSFGAAFGDLDGDGDLDLVYVNYQDNVSVMRNDCSAGHRVILDLRGTASNRFAVGATARIETDSGIQVRQLVLARGYMSASEPMIHFGLGADTRIKRLTVEWPSGHVQTFENLPVDRRYKITEPSTPPPAPPGPGQLPKGMFENVTQVSGLAIGSHEEEVDELANQRLLPVRLNRRGPALAVSDIDGDGFDDIVMGGTTLDPLRILHGTAGGAFVEGPAPGTMSGIPVDDGPVLLFDVNGDGRDDLLVTKGGNSLPAESPEYQPLLFLNDGGAFKPAPNGALPSLPISAGAAVAADFDRDGKLDVFIGARVYSYLYPYSPRSALLANRGGRFEDVTDSIAPELREAGMITSALWSDVDDDGWPDLLLTIDWGNIRYFHNNAGKTFEDWTTRSGFVSAGTGWWTSITAADFNGDGRMDYVVGNVGLNTQYRADADHPALIFAGDLKGDGTNQLIEAYYEGDTVYPWRTRRDLAQAIPSITRRFPRNDLYARATLQEIVGEDKLAAADRFAATELRSGILLSQAGGTYRFSPLPHVAQIAPFQGMVTGDFDGDGNTDLYAVQNSYAPIPAVGRFDGGLSQMFRGNGHGGFKPVSLVESGLIVPGDAKALVLLDLDRDDRPDFLLSRNNSGLQAFRNSVSAGGSLRVQLRGPAGNRAAIGARITVVLADGSTQTSEISAGSSYNSQSPASAFFGHPVSNPPKLIRVRWPSGGTTEQEFATGTKALTIAAPTESSQR